MITCYYCKGKHAEVAQVKACSQKAADLAKVEIGTIVEDAKKVTVPAHRTSAKYLALKAKIAPQNGGDQFLADIAKLQQVADANPGISIEAGIMKAATIDAAVVKMGQSLELGMYQLTNDKGVTTIYKVKFNKTNTYKYAEKLEITAPYFSGDKPKGKFVFAPGIINKLTSNDKMSKEQAKAFHDLTKKKYGQDYGFCCVCGKLLTVKKSIDAGIGPKCATYFA